MRIAHYGHNQTPQAKLFSDVLEDLQGRSFQILTELQLCHFVIRGRNTIRTIAYKEHGMHFAIRKLNAAEKKGFATERHIEADFMLVGMKVYNSQYYQKDLMRSESDEPLCTWPRILYFAEEDVVELPVTGRDVALISRAIMEHLMRAEGTIAETEITAELHDAYAELLVKPRQMSEWD